MSQAGIEPLYDMYNKYGQFNSKAVVVDDGSSAFLTFKKTVDGIAQYSLVLFDGENEQKINPPMSPRPLGAEIFARITDKTLPDNQKPMEYAGVCFKVKGRIFASFYNSSIMKRKPEQVLPQMEFRKDINTEPKESSMYLYEYINGKFEPFLISDMLHYSLIKVVTEMDETNEEMTSFQKIKNDPEVQKMIDEYKNRKYTFSEINDVLFQSKDFVVVNITINGKSGYHLFDGKDFTFMYDAPDTYNSSNLVSKSTKYLENDFVYMVFYDNKLFSIVQESEGKRSSGGAWIQTITERNLHMFDPETKKDVVLTHNQISEDPYGLAKDDLYLQWKTRYEQIQDAKMMLSVVNDNVFYAARTSDNQGYDLFYYSRKSNGLQSLNLPSSLVGLRSDEHTQQYIGCVGYVNSKFLILGYLHKSNDGKPDWFLVEYDVSKKPVMVSTKWKVAIKGYWSNLSHDFSAYKIGDRRILHYLDFEDYGANILYDGTTLSKYEGFKSVVKSERKYDIHHSPKNYFSVNGRSFVSLPVDDINGSTFRYKWGLCEWTYDPSEVLIMKQY